MNSHELQLLAVTSA